MASTGPDAFNHALHTANIWLADIGSAFGTRDRRYSQRALRAWLHGLRDRLTVDATVKFGAQLPELIRGAYYEGWEPHKTPEKYGVDRYIQRFAAEAGIPPVQVPATAATITGVLADHMSPGQIEETLAQLPTDLRGTITGGSPPRHEPAGAPAAARTAETPSTQDRLARLEDQIAGLTEAVRALARGLEDGQLTGIDQTHVSRAARLADEILLAAEVRSSR